MTYGLPGIGEANWGQKVNDSITAVKATVDAKTWQPATAYAGGAVVMAPDGSLVKAKVAFTSGAAYSAADWTSVDTTAGTQACNELQAAYGYPSRALIDGTDQRATIATEIAAAVALGLDYVLPAGVISVSMGAVPGYAGFYAGIVIPSGLRVRGKGRNSTVIKLLPSQPYNISSGDGASVIYNQTLLPARATVTIDPNATANNEVTYTAKTAGTDGNSIRVTYVNPGTASAALTVTTSNNDISVSLATDAGSAVTSTALQVRDAVNAYAAAAALVTAALPAATTGAGVVAAVAFASLTGGTDGDEGIVLEDLTVDGNAANQTGTHNGVTLIRTRGARLNRVRVKNVRGVGATPPAETFHFETQLGIDTTFTDCDAVAGRGVATASGFSADNATGVHYSGCIARNMKDGMGFTHYQCQSVSYSNCRAYSNGAHGFNSEESRSVTYSGCHAGGEAASGTTPYPFTAGTSLGNAASGFVVNGTKQASLNGCTSRRNGTGLTIVEGTLGAEGRITGCFLTDNGAGISCSNATTIARWFLDQTSLVAANTTAQFDFPATLGGYILGPGNQISPTPTVPASGTAVTNQYPWKVSVYLAGGTLSLLRVNGVDIDIANKHVLLDSGMTLAIFYSVAPTWLWFAL